MLSLLLSNRITKDDSIEWAETIILTFLYDWDEKNTDEEHDIVFNILQSIESMDEEGWELSKNEIEEMYNEISRIC